MNGLIFYILSNPGKIPERNDLLKILESGVDIKWDILLSILGGILFGPTPLDESNCFIISSISLGSV